MVLRRTVLAVAVVIAGCSTSDKTQSGDASDIALIADALAQVQSVAPTTSRVWPSFELADQIVLVTLPHAGVAYLIGDSNPPSEYTPGNVSGVFVRRGALPDSLAGLQIGADWNGRSGIATIVPIPQGAEAQAHHFIVHEAFHTHQALMNLSDGASFEQQTKPTVVADSLELLRLLNLEALYLAAALTSDDASTSREAAIAALAVRGHRCGLSDGPGCVSERGVELNEGSATYVTSVLLAEVLGYGSDGVWADSLAVALFPISDLRRLERWHFYDTGHVWLRLIERFAPDMPHAVLATTPPDLVLATLLGIDDTDATTHFREMAGNPAAAEADRAAQEALGLEVARQDSARRAFTERPGMRVTVYFGRVQSMSSEEARGEDGQPIVTLRFGGNRVTFRGPVERFCCPLGASTIAQVQGQTARVGSTPVRLDSPGSATGATILELDAVSMELQQAEIVIFADSVVVRAIDAR